MNRSIKVCSWNVRGLGETVKCGHVLSELLSSSAEIVLLQETKLADISSLKLYSFLPRRLDNYHHFPANGSSGGILTAWSGSAFAQISVSSTPNTLTVCLTSTATNLSLRITNVYAPASPELRPVFLDELKNISYPSNTPWLICGDFNMIRYAHEKNNNFRQSEAEAFNDCINDLNLIELPLLDRLYTWSNKRSTPTLERLDRAFINLAWDEALPSTILSSLTRSTSDHVPLKIEISTTIPKSKFFRFKNYWIKVAGFRDVVTSV